MNLYGKQCHTVIPQVGTQIIFWSTACTLYGDKLNIQVVRREATNEIN